MFYNLLAFEFRYQFQQKAFIGFALLFLALGILKGSLGQSLAAIDFNAPYQISFDIGLTTLGCMFGIMFFVISGVLRDREYLMEGLIYTTALTKKQFFFSRFLGVFMASLLAFGMVVIGLALGNLSPSLDPDRLADFQFGSYLWTFLIFVLPNVFICTAIIFSVGLLSKNHLATYLSAIAIYGLYFICSIFLNSPLMAQAVPAAPENMMYAAIGDPFGLAAFFEQTEYWTPAEKNSRWIALAGIFLWNRVLWMSIAISLLAISYQLFSFTKWRGSAVKSVKKAKTTSEIIPLKKYRAANTIQFSVQAQFASFWSLLKIELTTIFKGLPFIAILFIWIVIVTTEIYSRINQSGAYNDSLYPTTSLLIWLIEEPLMILSLLLIIFYSGELVWREHRLNFKEILDATPVSNGHLFLAKTTAFILLPAILMGISILIAIGFQFGKGYYQFEFWQYSSFFYFSGSQILFYLLLAFFIQSICANKYLGMAITGLFFIVFSSGLSPILGIEHPLLRIGRFPPIVYTDMNGFGDYLKKFHHFALHWTILGGLLTLLSFKLWRRGIIQPFSVNIRQALSHWKKWELGLGGLLIIAFLTTGSTIFYHTNIVNEYETMEDKLDFKETYERKYKRYEDKAMPILTSIKTEMDLYPTKNSYHLKADNTLKNISTESIDTILISEKEKLATIWIEDATLIAQDSQLGVYLFQLNTPLLPQQEINCQFELTKIKKGYERSNAFVRNGTYLNHNSIVPSFGYRASLEISDNSERKKRGLAVLEKEVITDTHLQEDHDRAFEKLDFETIISTQSDQTAIAPGDLIKKWTVDNLNYFHYKTPIKTAPAIHYVSANYQQSTTVHKGISLEHYYHAGHEYNNANIIKSSLAALDYCQEQFGNYAFNHLRIVEIPSHWNFGGQARPGLISMVADRLYLIDNRHKEGFDLVAKRSIHEVAHQWWGIMLTPKYSEGGMLFVEGLAKYTEAVVMEQIYGKRAIWQLSESANERYFSGRAYATETEPPLYHAEGEGYLAYGKSYTAMLAMKELIGEEKVNIAFRYLFDQHKNDLQPNSHSLELLTALYEVTPEIYHVLIDDWFKRVITYDLKIEESAVVQKNNGQYEVKLTVKAQRLELQENGLMTPIPIDEPIQIGLFTKHPSELSVETPILYLEAHSINQEQTELTILVDKKPAYMAIDPFGTRLDVNRLDNVVEISKD